MHKISPPMQNAYDWKFEQNRKEIYVTMLFPNSFDIQSIEAKLLDDNRSITVKAPNHISFLAGYLEYEVSKVHLEYIQENEKKVVVHIVKKESKIWNIIIKDATIATKEIDPKSAYLVSVVIINANFSLYEQFRTKINNLLDFACKVEYVPCLIYCGSLFLRKPEAENLGLSYLQIAKDKYRNPEAMYYIGYHFLTHDKKEEGVALLEESLNNGFNDASYILGEILSPASDFDGGRKKDGKAAIQMFEKNKTSRAMLEIARIYFYGCENVQKDVQKANELYAEAKKLDENLPPLCK